ncbi:MAG: carbon storage regulator [Gammaproteobacteria bacterium]|nr:carbon storage regulator [Gammaproteobacteria bacterium]
MLVLSRKIGEKLRVGENVAITVLGVSGRHVRIGIESPQRIPIYREEAVRKTPRLPAAGAHD